MISTVFKYIVAVQYHVYSHLTSFVINEISCFLFFSLKHPIIIPYLFQTCLISSNLLRFLTIQMLLNHLCYLWAVRKVKEVGHNFL